MPDEPFGAAIGYGLLVAKDTGGTFQPTDVLHAPPVITGGLGYVPLFKTPTLATEWIADMARRGVAVEAVAVKTADELTDLLADLKDIGATHVSIDPRPEGDAPNPGGSSNPLIPIAQAIIGFSVSG
jgi:hypothetical protein